MNPYPPAGPRFGSRPFSPRPESRPRLGPPPGSEAWRKPWAQMKYWSFQPCIYPAMLGAVSPEAKAGDLVNVYDKEGNPFGAGIYHPRARVPLRVIYHGADVITEDWFTQLIDRALELRLSVLELPAQTDAFRVIHSDGDGLSGLVVDKFSDVLSIECHSFGIAQRLPAWLPRLHEKLGTKRVMFEVDDKIARIEGISPKAIPSDDLRSARIREHGVRYEVDFESGHKTGFFCDQRDNRRRLAAFSKDKRVLDLCCYTGGFALAAKVLGQAADVTGVDLDEKAIEQAKRNMNLNQTRVTWVHCDAFSYARQVQQNNETWDTVVLDPPKLILSRDDEEDGMRKYEDLNRLALRLVRAGGTFVTCSCSGLLSAEEFERLVCRAAHKEKKRVQFLDRTGPGADHPVMSNCPESRYLKVLWARVL